MGFVLSLLAYLLFGIVAVINFPIVLITHAKKHGFFKVVNKYWFTNALELDKYGNHNYRTTWNVLFSSGGYRFGVRNETISSALGKKQVQKSLTVGGWIMVYMLWAIDIKYWKRGGHCYNSIMPENEIRKLNVNL